MNIKKRLFWSFFWNLKPIIRRNPALVTDRDITLKTMELIAGDIAEKMQLNHDDTLLDFGCGEGYITSKLSERAGAVFAYEKIGNMRKAAQKRDYSGNVKVFRKLKRIPLEKVNKVLLYSVIHYLDIKELSKVISFLKNKIKAKHIIFIGDIPDKDYLDDFWKNLLSAKKMSFYDKLNISMWNWYDKAALEKFAHNMSYNPKFLKQKEELPYSNVRIDLFLKNK